MNLDRSGSSCSPLPVSGAAGFPVMATVPLGLALGTFHVHLQDIKKGAWGQLAENRTPSQSSAANLGEPLCFLVTVLSVRLPQDSSALH